MGPRESRNRRRGSKGIFDCRLLFGLVLLAGLAAGGCEFQHHPRTRLAGGEAGENTAGVDVPPMLEASAASWNAGDVEGFLDDYLRSDELTFSGAEGVTRGWEDLRNRYLEKYWAPGTVRDSLVFEDLEVFPLGADHALTLGRYVLLPRGEPGAEPNTGFFSLILVKQDEGWKIVHDHTTAAPSNEDPPGEDGSTGARPGGLEERT